jgi:alanine racemase
MRAVHEAPGLRLAGLMTHISAPDGLADPETLRQLALFERIRCDALREGLRPDWVHAANSATLFTGRRANYDTVRPGIAAYGALASHLSGARALRPVLALRSQVVFLKDIPAGTPVGYGSTWRAPRPTRLATLPLGYNDGVPWTREGCGDVLIRGRRAPIVGRVSMDYTTVDVGMIPDVRVGDAATIIGRDGEQEITLEELAERAGTIAHQVSCSVGRRVLRVHRGGEELLLAQQMGAGGRLREPSFDFEPEFGPPHATRRGGAGP